MLCDGNKYTYIRAYIHTYIHTYVHGIHTYTFTDIHAYFVQKHAGMHEALLKPPEIAEGVYGCRLKI